METIPSVNRTTGRPKKAKPAPVSDPKIISTVVEARSTIPTSRKEDKKPTFSGKNHQKTAEAGVKDDKIVKARQATENAAAVKKRKPPPAQSGTH